MVRFRIDATWHLEDEDSHVEVVFEIVEPLAAEHAQHLRARGLLAEADDQVSRREIGRLRVEDLRSMTEKRVRAQGLEWLRERAGMTDLDSFELRIAAKADLEVLARLEAAVAH